MTTHSGKSIILKISTLTDHYDNKSKTLLRSWKHIYVSLLHPQKILDSLLQSSLASFQQDLLIKCEAFTTVRDLVETVESHALTSQLSLFIYTHHFGFPCFLVDFPNKIEQPF